MEFFLIGFAALGVAALLYVSLKLYGLMGRLLDTMAIFLSFFGRTLNDFDASLFKYAVHLYNTSGDINVVRAAFQPNAQGAIVVPAEFGPVSPSNNETTSGDVQPDAPTDGSTKH